MKAVATLTMNPTIDIASSVRKVLPERKLRCDEPSRDPGGGGINVARVIHQLGGTAMALYIAGGATGQLLHKIVRREGIEARRIEIEKLTRENMTITEAESGNQFRFVFPGPSIRRSEWQQCLDMLGLFIPRPAYIVASGSLPPGVPVDFYAQAAQVAKRIDARFVLDTTGEPLCAALGKDVYLIKPNRRELEDATGQELSDPQVQEEVCRELVDKGKCQMIALTLGESGTLFTAKGLQARIKGPPVQVVSAVGAGDSFLGGLVFALTEDYPLADAFRYAIAAGTAAVLTPGTQLCRKRDVERIYKEMAGQKG
ncbi:MAG: 1-phosphofructokinase family hexose kinase [Desulfuromonadales bacterium]